MENLEKVVTVFKKAIPFPDKGMVLVETENGTFSYFREKKDGGITKASETLKLINPQNGDDIVVGYKVNGQYKNAVFFSRPSENDVPSTTSTRDYQQQTEKDAIYKLAENQNKLVAKIQGLEKRLSGIETHILGDPSKKESLDLHQSFPTKKLPTIKLDDTATMEDAEEIFGEKSPF